MTRPAARSPGGRPVPPLLAVIDMQRVFGEPGSKWLAPRFAEIVGPVRRLVHAFRPRVIFTRFVAPPRPGRGVAEVLRAVAVRAAAGRCADL